MGRKLPMGDFLWMHAKEVKRQAALLRRVLSLDGPKPPPNECCTNERQSRDSNPGTTNARFRYDRQRTLVIRIEAITLASDSAITSA